MLNGFITAKLFLSLRVRVNFTDNLFNSNRGKDSQTEESKYCYSPRAPSDDFGYTEAMDRRRRRRIYR